MFERYTEKARRVIFFARYEASQFGSPYIETEHLLLGMLREDKALTNRFLRSHSSVESIRKQIDAHTTIREKVSTSVDLPLSNECKRILAGSRNRTFWSVETDDVNISLTPSTCANTRNQGVFRPRLRNAAAAILHLRRVPTADEGRPFSRAFHPMSTCDQTRNAVSTARRALPPSNKPRRLLMHVTNVD